MTWGRFGYVCRKANVDCQAHESLAECIDRIEKETAADFYGKRNSKKNGSAKYWPEAILMSISQLPKEQGLQAIKLYRQLELDKCLFEPIRIKRLIAYMLYVTLVFFVSNSIYHNRIAPTFLQFFETIELAPPPSLLFFTSYGWSISAGIAGLLVLLLISTWQAKRLFTFLVAADKSVFFKYFLSRKIQCSYSRLMDVLQFPLRSESHLSTPLSQHLNHVKNANLDLSAEMQALIEIEFRQLSKHCEKHIKVMSSMVALIVILSVFFFLQSIYAPIFTSGDAI